jgi:YD repeat-containing protein
VDARSGIVTTLYDAVGNNTTVVDQVGNTTTMTFDALNRMTKQTDPLNHSSTMAFDALGRQTSTTDRDGQVIKHHFRQRWPGAGAGLEKQWRHHGRYVNRRRLANR